MNDEFLKDLANHEEKKKIKELSARQRIIMFSGVGLNSIGDYVGNPKMKWEEKDLLLEEIEFTGLDKFILEECGRSPIRFREKVLQDEDLKIKYEKEASNGDEPILVRKSPKPDKHRLVDGVHRLIGAALDGQETIKAMVPLNEGEILPICEAHTIYDLIRGFIRHRQIKEGEIELYYGLKLLLNTYANTRDLLKNRFNINYVNDEKVQTIIKKVLKG